MQLAIIQKIDGVDFVTSLTKPYIDPIATKQKYDAYFKATDLYNQIEDVKKKYASQIAIMQKASAASIYKKAQEKLTSLHSQLMDLSKQEKDLKSGFYKKSAVYFETGRNEKYISEKIANQFKTLDKNQYLSTDGKIYTDYRGKVFYTKIRGLWKRTEIEKLTDEKPNDAIEHLDSKAQLEYEKQLFNALSNEEQNKYIFELENIALESAKTLRNELEIKGEKRALEIAQSHYQSEMDKIKNDFGR